MSPRIYTIGIVLSIILVLIGRFTAPTKVETRVVERVVTRETENTNRNQNVIETTKETRLPDGTVVKETRKEKETSSQKERHSETDKTSIATKSIETRPSYRVGVLYEPAIKTFQDTSYSVILEKRLFSELYLGVAGGSRRTIGVTLSIGF